MQSMLIILRLNACATHLTTRQVNVKYAFVLFVQTDRHHMKE